MWGKLNSLKNYLQVFATPADISKFRRIYKDNHIENQNHLVQLRLKESNFPLYCRPNTTDAQVLWDTFYGKYHLPPIPIRDDSVILDLGANVGYTIAHFAFLYKKSHIYGVEMDNENFLLAQKNTEHLGNRSTLLHCAIWNSNGTISYGGDTEWGYSIVHGNSETNVHKSPAKTIDSIIDDYNLTKIDYLKMDIEGAEKFVVAKPAKWLNCVRSIKIEIHPPSNVKECLEVLESEGFKCKEDIHSTTPCLIGVQS